MRTTATFTLVVLAGLMGACSSTPPEVKEMQKAEKVGRFNAAFTTARDILDNQDKYTAEQVAEANEVYNRVAPRIARSYLTAIRQSMTRGDANTVVATYDTARLEVPAIEADPEVLRLLMRAEVQSGEWARARETAASLKAFATNPAYTTEAEEFIRDLDEFDRVRARIESLRSRVEQVSLKTGKSYTGNESGGATCQIMAGIDELEERDQMAVTEYFQMITERNYLESELTRVRPAPPVSTGEASASS